MQSYILEELNMRSHDNELVQLYIELIDTAINQNRRRYRKDSDKYIYYEEHHILPKSLYPDFRLDKNNKVLLTASEHFTAHKLLTTIFPGQQMAHAFWKMCCCNGSKNIITESDYALARKIVADYPPAKGLKLSEESKKKISDRSKEFWQRGGYVHTKEQDIKMVETRRKNGSYLRSKEANNKASETLKGRIFINNGEINKRIYPEELEGYLKAGWLRGKKPLSEEHKKKIGKAGVGRESWNKGKPGTFLGKKHTEETKKKMSETKKKNREMKLLDVSE